MAQLTRADPWFGVGVVPLTVAIVADETDVQLSPGCPTATPHSHTKALRESLMLGGGD
jgi:hypothetical protein